MKKIVITALLGLLLTPAYAESQKGFDRDELYEQVRIDSQYAERKLTDIVQRKTAGMTPEQYQRLRGDQQRMNAFNQSARRELIQSWPAYMNRCYAGTAARLCAYRDISFHQHLEFIMKAAGDRQPMVPLHAKTRAWVRQNPRLAEMVKAEIDGLIRAAAW